MKKKKKEKESWESGFIINAHHLHLCLQYLRQKHLKDDDDVHIRSTKTLVVMSK